MPGSINHPVLCSYDVHMHHVCKQWKAAVTAHVWDHWSICTWRSNTLPRAHTGRWQSHHAGRWASCRTLPAACAAAGCGDWWPRWQRGSHLGWGTVSGPRQASWETLLHVPKTQTHWRYSTHKKENSVFNYSPSFQGLIFCYGTHTHTKKIFGRMFQLFCQYTLN